uniref:Uncharacterized protein n=1 Tax=Lotus japonicus TaxID=34305 RepID=I3SQP2_LOTJA|nr:unknown [Lotus japonicus]
MLIPQNLYKFRMSSLFQRMRKWIKVFLVMPLLKETEIWQLMMNLFFPSYHLKHCLKKPAIWKI